MGLDDGDGELLGLGSVGGAELDLSAGYGLLFLDLYWSGEMTNIEGGGGITAH